MGLQVINLKQADKWLEILNMCYLYDFYHCPSYHELSIDNSNYQANLVTYQEGDYIIAIPLIIRPVNEIEGLESSDCNDATSVYGYVGPVSSHQTVPEKIIRNFQGNLNKYLKDNNVVCAFSRLHPLISQQPLLKGIGEIMHIGQTISIDLRLPMDEQYSRYRRNHKRDIRKLRRLGVYCIIDQPAAYIEGFIDMYNENMKRVEARGEYFFNRAYFHEILAAKDYDMHLFVCFFDDDMVCGGLFSLCRGIVQAHIAAGKRKYLELAPMKLLIDEVRIWANEVGALHFHLGGGLGAEEDSLFKFKAGFSDTLHTFYVWQLVVMNKKYVELFRNKALYDESRSCGLMKDNYFPGYRYPAT